MSYTRDALSARIRDICRTLEHDKFLTPERKEQLETELNHLLVQRNRLDQHADK